MSKRKADDLPRSDSNGEPRTRTRKDYRIEYFDTESNGNARTFVTVNSPTDAKKVKEALLSALQSGDLAADGVENPGVRAVATTEL